MLNFVIKLTERQELKLQKVVEQYKKLGRILNDKDVTFQQLKDLKNKNSLNYLKNANLSAIMNPKLRNNLTFMFGFSFTQKDSGMTYLTINDIGKYLSSLRKIPPGRFAISVEKSDLGWIVTLN